jgi:TonB family protein
MEERIDGEKYKTRYSLLEFYDKSGNQTASNGNGAATRFYNNGEIKESGEYSNSLKSGKWAFYHDNGELKESGSFEAEKRIGVWRGWNDDGREYYTETYSNPGELISGKSYDKEGVQYEYTETEIQAEAFGGMQAFYKYVGDNMVYPTDARRMGIEGRVYVQFVVDKDGGLIDVKTVKGIGYSCDMEAERVIKESVKWKPGVQRGIVVKQRMILPIIFKLTDKEMKKKR